MKGTLVVGGAAGGSATMTDELDETETEGGRTATTAGSLGRATARTGARDRDRRLRPGPDNAITDVAGVRVGHTTLIEGDDVRTGVTVVVPPTRAALRRRHRMNGNGEVTGLEWLRESGMLTTPIGLTNTHSVGVVRDAIVASRARRGRHWSLPVVGET